MRYQIIYKNIDELLINFNMIYKISMDSY